jgi:hypothetical protein
VVDSDVRQFVRAREAGAHEEMVRIYSGPLLDGFHVDGSPEFEQWLAGERARLARDYAEALRALATAAEDRNQHDQAANWWARAVEHDPLSSPLVLRYLRALTAAGDRATAIKVADAHVKVAEGRAEPYADRDLQLEMDRIRRVEATQPTQRLTDLPTHPTQPTQPTQRPNRPNRLIRPTRPTDHPTTQWRPAAVIAIAIIALFGVRQWMRASDAASRAQPYDRGASIPEPGLRFLDRTFRRRTPGRTAHPAHQGRFAPGGGRTSVGGYDGSEKPVEQIARELGVRSVALGSVQVDGNRLRVIVRLVDAGTRQDLWGEHYDRTLEDAFAVQSDIARQIVAALGARLTVAEAGAIDEAPTSSPQAYQLFLQGRDYHRRPAGSGRTCDRRAAVLASGGTRLDVRCSARGARAGHPRSLRTQV